MTNRKAPSPVVVVKTPGSRVWHLQGHSSAVRLRTICGKTFANWRATFGIQDDGYLCKNCLRRLDDALGARYQIMDVGAKK